MNKIIDNYTDGWKRIVDFSGKSTRAQFWTFYLINILVDVLLTAILKDTLAITLAISVAFFIAGLSSVIRRLHDTKRSGWALLWFLLPLIGWIILIVYWLQPSK